MHTCITNSMPPKAETQATEARRGASWLQLLAAAAAGAALCSSALLAHDAGRRPSMSIVDRELLAGSIFVGHLAPDMDSVAAAVASAELYVGTAAVASNLNSESKWAMQYWKASSPALVDQVIAAHEKTLGRARVCLVDFQQTTQMHPAIKESSVVGVIDHHALQSKTLTTKEAIFINIRPWGSTCTLLAEEFARVGRTPSRATAGIMLSAVLSDTLNLKGPTTTERDRRMVAELAQQLGVTDVAALAAEQFKAKSAELATVPARELIEADMKEFSFANASGVPQRPVAIASIETTDTAPVLSRTAELQAEVRRVKEARSLDALLLVVVDIVKMQSIVILADAHDTALAKMAFPDGRTMAQEEVCVLAQAPPPADGCGGGVFSIGSRVSRKKDLVPPVQQAIQDGWKALASEATGNYYGNTLEVASNLCR